MRWKVAYKNHGEPFCFLQEGIDEEKMGHFGEFRACHGTTGHKIPLRWAEFLL